MDGAITWCGTSAWTRIFSAHRLGWYRYVVAYAGPAFVAAGVADATSIPAPIGGTAIVGLSLLLLWLLPGARVGCGFSSAGIHSRRWLLVRRVRWEDTAMIELGVVNFDLGFRMGGRVGGVVLATNGRRMDLRGLPWFARWRGPALEPLLLAATEHGVPIVMNRGAERWFPEVDADVVGAPRYRDSAWTA